MLREKLLAGTIIIAATGNVQAGPVPLGPLPGHGHPAQPQEAGPGPLQPQPSGYWCQIIVTIIFAILGLPIPIVIPVANYKDDGGASEIFTSPLAICAIFMGLIGGATIGATPSSRAQILFKVTISVGHVIGYTASIINAVQKPYDYTANYLPAYMAFSVSIVVVILCEVVRATTH